MNQRTVVNISTLELCSCCAALATAKEVPVPSRDLEGAILSPLEI